MTTTNDEQELLNNNQVPSKVMEGSCNLILCNCRNASEITDDYVKNKIEVCIQNYRTLEETMTYLQDNHQICHYLTKTIWEKLQEESPDFFKNYYLRCKVARQTKMFNELLAKQVALMLKAGDLKINSPGIMNLLRQYPEAIRLMDDQANTSASKTKTVSPSLALPYSNGPSVTQLQVPSLAPSYTDGPSVPQLQIPSLPLPYTNGPSVTQLQIPNDRINQLHPCQQSTSNDLPYGYAAPTYAPAALAQWPSSDDLAYDLGAPNNAPAALAQWPSSNDLAYDLGAPNYAPAAVDRWPSSNDLTYGYGAQPYTPEAVDQWSSSPDIPYGYGAPTFASAATTPQYPLASILDVGGDTGQYDPIFQGMDVDSLLQLQSLYGQCQQPMPLQQNFPIGAQAQQILQSGEGSNGLQNGESFDQRICHNVHTNQPMRMCTSVDQQQARGVIQHPHPDSTALNTPYSDDWTIPTAQNQHCLKRQKLLKDP